MAKEEGEGLPKVLVMGPPTCFTTLEPLYSHKFNFITCPNHSSLSLHQHSSVRALLCSSACSITADLLRLLPSLCLIVTASAGTDHIDFAECRRRGIHVAGAGGLFSEEVADAAVALLIAAMRKIPAADRYVRTRKQFHYALDFPLGFKLSGKRVGIVGLGSIGMEVAKRLESFGCMILYHSRQQKAVSYPFYSDVVELAATSNALVVCCALNEQTRHIINREVMLALGKDGFIVNVGRGGLIDEKQLVKCLMEGDIGGAGLDVFENEPHVPRELFSMDNVVLSPHCAVFTSECIMSLCELVAGNLGSFFSNMPLITPMILG